MSIQSLKYKISNLQRFLQAFDKAIETYQSVLIPAKDTGMSVSSLHQRASEALCMLVYHSENIKRSNIILKYKQEDYAKLRASTKLSITEDGLVINFHKNLKIKELKYNNLENNAKDMNNLSTQLIQVFWKKDFIEFLENPNIKTFRRDNLKLNAEDQIFIIDLIKDEEGWVNKITKNSIEVIKK